MADFSSGVKDYIIGTATVQAFFPIDFKDKSEICCRQCRFYRISSRKCGLNEELIPYPENHIGPFCPLDFERNNGL
ncbi:MAG: hypothetical protein ACI4I1_08210 [Oscillospiraceae bacterium]